MRVFAVLLLVAGTLSMSQAGRSLSENAGVVNISQKFEEWMLQHKRVYPSQQEKEKRFAIFKSKFERAESFNKHGRRSFTLGLNLFSDMTTHEVVAEYACTFPVLNSSNFQVPHSHSDDYEDPYEDYDVCTSIDWSSEGVMGPVRTQNGCGCCWAMASVAAVEAINRIVFGNQNVAPLSPQQLIDCTTATNYGCAGGHPRYAFEYIMGNGGITSEANYPYEARNGTCNMFKAKQRAAYVTGVGVVSRNNEEELAKIVCQQPVVVGIQSGSAQFDQYNGGLYDSECGPKRNHMVTLVGFGKDENGQEYWKLLTGPALCPERLKT